MVKDSQKVENFHHKIRTIFLPVNALECMTAVTFLAVNSLQSGVYELQLSLKIVQTVAQINKLNNVILNLFQNLWTLRDYKTLKQVQGDNTWFEQQPVNTS